MGDRFMDLIPGAMSGGDELYIPPADLLYIPENRSADTDDLPNEGTAGSAYNTVRNSGAVPIPNVTVAGRTGFNAAYATNSNYKFVATNTGVPNLSADNGLTTCGWYYLPSAQNIVFPIIGGISDYIIGVSSPGADRYRFGYESSTGVLQTVDTPVTGMVSAAWIFWEARYTPAADGGPAIQGSISVTSFKDTYDVAPSVKAVGRKIVSAGSEDIFIPPTDSGNVAGTVCGAHAVWINEKLSDAQLQAIFAGRILG